MRRAILTLSAAVLLACGLAGSAQAAECEPKASCFGLESVEASLSTHQAGAHPDVTISFELVQDPETPLNPAGFHDAYARLRDLTVDTPPGLLGNPNVLGTGQQCTVEELSKGLEALCPNGSQVGTSTAVLHDFSRPFVEPLYMMVPPAGSDIVARLGFIAGLYPALIDLKVRSEGDYGLSAELPSVTPQAQLISAQTMLWGVPAAEAHDTERMTPAEAFEAVGGVGGGGTSEPRPPGSRPLAFLTNPTRCGVPLSFEVSADSWLEPQRLSTQSGEIDPITGCDSVPFNPSLFVQPTSRRAGAPTGLELSFRLPAPDGVNVLESSQLRDLRIDFPPGMGINTAAADGLATCSVQQVRFGERAASECPDAAKLADTEFDVPALPRRMKGAIYLREPEPGHLFRVWIVADDLGAHVKLPGELEVDEGTGQIHSVVFDVPQVPVREVRLLLKSGLRAPLVNPQHCGTYQTHWEFAPWSGTGAVEGDTPMSVDEGCDTGGFNPKLSAGSTDPSAGAHAPFVFTLNREDGEQNPASLDLALPPGLVATFTGIPRCGGAAALTGACPPNSRIGRVVAATGAGPAPLWVPQPGKRPTSLYLGGPYKGGPLSVIAVVPAQAGPFDLGDQVVRTAIYVDPETARASAKSDPFPQFVQGVPVLYRTIEVLLDRPGFALNPTSCRPKSVDTTVRSIQGALAHPSAYFQAAGCAALGFKPSLSLSLKGGTKRGSHPALKAVVRPRAGDANIGSAQVTLPHSAFLDQAHIRTICTRVQFAAGAGNGANCPPESVYGQARAITPLFDEPLEGPVYLRSSSHNLPDLVVALKGPPSLPIAFDLDGRIDSVKGGIRGTFEAVPDAPVSEFTLEMQGGKKGLIVNSTNLCNSINRAKADYAGQNGKAYEAQPAMRAGCPKGHKRHKRHPKRHNHRAAH